jgi:hypothetical protein
LAVEIAAAITGIVAAGWVIDPLVVIPLTTAVTAVAAGRWAANGERAVATHRAAGHWANASGAPEQAGC